ncbi:hypothetical protein [Marinococcus halophilus]|uniref:hypothetical protein n=1 Tax=Marinococcus halophilus TaxID=1371 RepID=UPI001303518C|nr:hypothetical protein [Marinococcus halophilus]
MSVFDIVEVVTPSQWLIVITQSLSAVQSESSLLGRAITTLVFFLVRRNFCTKEKKNMPYSNQREKSLSTRSSELNAAIIFMYISGLLFLDGICSVTVYR